MRKLFLTFAASLFVVSATFFYMPDAIAGVCPSGQVSTVNLTTGEAECAILTGGDPGTGTPDRPMEDQGQASSSPYRNPTADEILALYGSADLRAEVLRSGALSAGAISAGSGDCLVAGGRAQQWNGSGWEDVGTLCPLNAIVAGRPPRVTPAQAAAAAIAKVQFTSAAPGAGPNRAVNKLPFDVPVGYPVWLWAEGGTTAPRTATDEVGGRSVKLTVTFEHLTWDLGDGSRSLTCGVGTKWDPSRPTGSKSPTCGYTYERMGEYTITATTYWRIDWVVDGVSGSQAYELSQRRPWSVGELQVLVR